MLGLPAEQVKNLLYLLPLLSALLCLLFMAVVKYRETLAAGSRRIWSYQSRPEPLQQRQQDQRQRHYGETSSIRDASIVGDELEMTHVMQEQDAALVLEYNDAALLEHAQRARISGDVRSLKHDIAAVLQKAGLARPSRNIFTGRYARILEAVKQLREMCRWLQHVPGAQSSEDVGMAFIMHSGTKASRALRVEPCTSLFNE